MAEDYSVRINEKERLQQAVMKRVLEKLQDTPYVLKGGAALLFTRGLDRHTTDLDFDSAKQLNIEKRLRDGLKASGVELISLKAVKNTDTVQRFKVHYRDPGTDDDVLFKVETSFRGNPDPNTVEKVNGIQTYKASEIFEQKLLAAQSRTQARDLYDLTHLVQGFGDDLSTEQINRVAKFSDDMDSLVDRYGNSFRLDATLTERTTIDDTVLSLREAVEAEQKRREMLVQHHDPKALANHCVELIRLTGVTKNGGSEVKGNRYLFRRQDDTVSISTMDGRGKIFQYGKGGVESRLTADDIHTLSKLPGLNARLKQQNIKLKQQQSKPSHRRSR